jgi:hypothetical protein
VTHASPHEPWQERGDHRRGDDGVETHGEAGEHDCDRIDRERARRADALRGEPDGEASRGVAVTPSMFISGVTITPPRMPVAMTRTPVSGAALPSPSVTAIATPAVIDFGASAIRTLRGAPSPLATRTADTIATTTTTAKSALAEAVASILSTQ